MAAPMPQSLATPSPEEASSDSPPAYQVEGVGTTSAPERSRSEARDKVTDAHWEQTCRGDWETALAWNLVFEFYLPETSPSESIEKKDVPQSKTWWDFLFAIRLPWTSRSNLAEKDALHSNTWHCRLEVTAKCLPRLMRTGFHWSEENILPDRGYAVIADQFQRFMPSDAKRGWTCMKMFHLKDLSVDTQWTATMEVLFKNEIELSRFKLGWLSVERVATVHAWNWGHQLVYRYSRDGDQGNFNMIYPDMPLSGWWPWPKALQLPSDDTVGH